MGSWGDATLALQAIAKRQLFFVGGAPRSGTTWLQQMLNAHPDVSCAGEGLFWRDLAVPIDGLVAARIKALQAKNTTLFRQTGGYPLPQGDHADHLVATAILLALHQQTAGQPFAAIGEKTPENLFFFPRLKKLLPTAKLIAIARDPRDVLASAWHIFGKSAVVTDLAAAKKQFLQKSLPSLSDGMRATIKLTQMYPADTAVVTYEALSANPEPVLASLFRFLGVSDHSGVLETCIDRTKFSELSGGRRPGQADPNSFYRNGRAGDWADTLDAEMNEIILQRVGWAFQNFGWKP